ncbi:MAG: endolytic transglycosylase MltG [Candidatus Adiutrix sp.]|jgi:UPF0755 protein|nr:endolytic transglycosylase MltG [Candidatus Adiutrix sp.]
MLNNPDNRPEAAPASEEDTLRESVAKTKKVRVKKIRTGPSLIGRLIGLVGVVAVLALVAGFLGALKYSNLFLAPETESREVVVTIPEGAGPARIGEALEEAGVIRSAKAFVWTIRVKNRLKKNKPVVLKAGEMALDPSKPVWDTIDLIAKGNYKVYPFTVPEGRNMYEIAGLIEAAGLGRGPDFLALCRDKGFIESLGLKADTLEGYLFPETYSFPKGTPLTTVVKTMTDTFFKVWAKYAEEAKSKGWSRQTVVTLASIVEKETGAPKERPVIAGVFWNRLEQGMKLQTDPTIVYGLLPDNYSGNITRKDIENPHPYNTYHIPGLPPGPIANPGEAAIQAVIRPEVVPYLYFVSKNDGTHQFSRTLAEHNKAVNQFQRGQKAPARGARR